MVRRLEDRCDEKRERKGQECAQEGASATRLSGRLCVQYPALEPGLGKTMGVIGSYSAPARVPPASGAAGIACAEFLKNPGLVAALSRDLPLGLKHAAGAASPSLCHLTMTGSVEKASVPINRSAIAETSVSAVHSKAPRLPVRAGNR